MDESNELAPAIGILNGLVLGAVMWLVFWAIVGPVIYFRYF